MKYNQRISKNLTYPAFKDKQLYDSYAVGDLIENEYINLNFRQKIFCLVLEKHPPEVARSETITVLILSTLKTKRLIPELIGIKI